MVEVWKDIEGFEGLYQVSTLGNIKSLKFGKERILNPGMQKNGYLYVILCKDGKCKSYLIHRLVAKAFIPNPNGYLFVNHKSGNKQENFVENLEWVSHQYNIEYSCAKPVLCLELNKVFKSIVEAERITGINAANICSCLKGRYNSAGGYHWQYVEK